MFRACVHALVNTALRHCEADADDITDSTVKTRNFRVDSQSRKPVGGDKSKVDKMK